MAVSNLIGLRNTCISGSYLVQDDTPRPARQINELHVVIGDVEAVQLTCLYRVWTPLQGSLQVMYPEQG